VGTLPDDQWHFVAFTNDIAGTPPRTLGVYLDGKSQGSFRIGPTLGGQRVDMSVHTCYIGIGGFPVGDRYFTGSVSGIRLWDGVRTATEIYNDMTNPCTTSQAGLIASIPLDEGQGTTFVVKGASGNIITTGTLDHAPGDITTNPVWNKPLTANPDPISDGIWFVIQNKADIATDFDIPAQRLALTVDSNNQIIMAKVPLKGNYDRFLWRAVPIGDSYLLVNKQNKGKALDDQGRLITLNGADRKQWSVLRRANLDKWGTNAYFLAHPSASPKRIAYDSQARRVVFSDANDTVINQVWLLQPMEVEMGYYIPAPPPNENVCPFTKKLDSEFGVTFYATTSTSEWALLNTHLVIRNEINALQVSHSSTTGSPTTAFTVWKVLVISGYDNNPDIVATYPMVKPIVDKWGIGTIRDYWGGTHPEWKTVLLTESMMSHQGVPYREGGDFMYREFEQVVHEFGHVIDSTILDGKAKEQPEAHGSNEWFPWRVQFWLNSAQSAGAGRNRSTLTPDATKYLSGIFNTSNDWLPPRWVRDHLLETFELRCGDVLAQGQALRSSSLDLVLRLQEDGNLTVNDADGFKWGSFQSLQIGPSKMVKMTEDGHLQLLDGSNKVLWTSPNNATPGARLIVSDPGSPGGYLKIIDKSSNPVWQST
jgi:hypothetical protein